MARNRKLRISPKVEAIVGDGPTEKHYFEQLNVICGIRNISIKPDLPDTARKGEGKYNKVFNRAESLLADDYDHVHCLIDYDAVIQERKTSDFQTKCRKLLKAYPNRLTIYINNPCFEMWLLLHYEKTSRSFDSCKRVETALKKYVKDYSKQQDYTRQLCSKLYPKISTAVSNAQTLEHQRDQYGEYYPRAEVHRLISALFLTQPGNTEIR